MNYGRLLRYKINDEEVRIKQTSIGLNYIDTYHRSNVSIYDEGECYGRVHAIG